MNIFKIYKFFPDHDSCLKYLEKVRWNNKSKCPYCQSGNQTPIVGMIVRKGKVYAQVQKKLDAKSLSR